MTKDEAIQFVQREHSLLENSFNAFYPHYDYRWDDEAEIILLDIQDKWGKTLSTRAISHEDRDEEWIRILTHRAIETFMKVHPEWTDVKCFPDGSISWGSSW
jgi:hypothetical protein